MASQQRKEAAKKAAQQVARAAAQNVNAETYRKSPMKTILSAVIVIIFILLGWYISDESALFTIPASDASMVVRFIDVGQGASTLISMGDDHILIDAGENDQGQTVVKALKDWKIEKLSLAIGTHPHSDHIGGMDTVLSSIKTEEYWMPDLVHTSKTFLSVLDVLEEKNIPIKHPQVGESWAVGGMVLTVLGPEKAEEEDLNNSSIVVRIESEYGSIVVPGDAEAESEKSILDMGLTLKSEVLQLGHHGSSTSNSDAFVKAVDPDYVVIPVGAGNSYGHPHDEILAMIEKRGYKAYRTDWHGDITCIMDAEGIRFETEKK